MGSRLGSAFSLYCIGEIVLPNFLRQRNRHELNRSVRRDRLQPCPGMSDFGEGLEGYLKNNGSFAQSAGKPIDDIKRLATG